MPFKSKVEISQNFVAFSEYMNFNWSAKMGGGRYRHPCGKEEMCKARPKSTKDIHFRRHSLQEIFGFIEYLNKAKTFTDKVILHLEWLVGLKHIV